MTDIEELIEELGQAAERARADVASAAQAPGPQNTAYADGRLTAFGEAKAMAVALVAARKDRAADTRSHDNAAAVQSEWEASEAKHGVKADDWSPHAPKKGSKR